MKNKLVKILFVCLFSVLLVGISTAGVPEISEELVGPKKIKPGDDIKVQYILTLTEDSSPDRKGAWATVKMYKGDPKVGLAEWKLAKDEQVPYAAISSDPMAIVFKNKPAGSKILVRLTIRGSQTSELSEGTYSLHAHGWAPGEFRKKIGEVIIGKERSKERSARGRDAFFQTVSEVSVMPKKIKPGDDVKVQYTLTLTQDSTLKRTGAWATVLVYKGDYDSKQKNPYVARSSYPKDIVFNGKPAGTKIFVKLTIIGDQTSELPEGTYSVYAYGWAPQQFREKIGEFKIIPK